MKTLHDAVLAAWYINNNKYSMFEFVNSVLTHQQYLYQQKLNNPLKS